MKLYSQRDPQWSANKMGDGTIGQFGCTITCIAMMTDIRPDVINNELKNVGGYSGNFLIWEKVESAVKGTDFVKRVRIYENSEVAANLPCLVEVNGAPIGGTTHWVLYIGNQKLWDPWDGTEKPTSAYAPIGYSVIKYTKPSTEPVPPVQPVITDQTKIPQIDNLEVQAIKSRLTDQFNQISSLNLTVNSLNAQVRDLQFKLDNLPPQDTNALALIKRMHDVLWGSGFWFVKYWEMQKLLPK